MMNITKIGFNKFKAGACIVFMLSSINLFSKNLDNPYENIEVKRTKSSIVKEFKRFTFLESVVAGKDGSVYVTNIPEGIIYKIRNKRSTILTKFKGKLVGLSMLDDRNLIVTGMSDKKEAIVLKVNVITGRYKIIAKLPNALLLNGITRLNKSNFLIADSFKGIIWKLDVNRGSASIWLDNYLLKRPSGKSQMPGVNGVKVHGKSVYISNTGKMLLVKIAVNKDYSSGKAEVVKENVFIDDFTIDYSGNIYAATHIFDSVIKITSMGKVTIIAQSDQGVAGSTCVTWKSKLQRILLVSSNGGMLKKNPDDVVNAKIVELELK